MASVPKPAVESVLKPFLWLILLGLLCFAPFGTLNAQSEIERYSAHYAPPVLGEVPREYLTMQAGHGFPFEILDHARVVRFEDDGDEIIARIEDTRRIKIHTDDPNIWIQAGLVTLPVLRGRESERIDGIRGINHLPDGRTMELEPADIRRTQYNSLFDLVEFLIPGIEQGSVIEYRYRITRSGIEELPAFHFSDRVPVRRASLHMVHQPYMRYDESLNDPGSNVRFVAERIDTSSARLLFSERRPEPLLITHWIAEDLPAEEASFDADPAPDARTGIRFLIGEFGLPRQPLENSWDVVNARLRRQFDPFEIAASDAASRLRFLGDSLATLHPADPARVIGEAYAYLQDRIRPDGTRGIFAELQPLDSLLSAEAADQASLNLGLMAILKGAGLRVEPIYHSWSQFGSMDTLFPSIHQLQGVLLAVKQEGEVGQADRWLLLDASNEGGRPGLIPVEVAGQQGLKLTEEGGFGWLALEGGVNRYASHVSFDGELTTEGVVRGRMTITLEGYPAQDASLRIAAGILPAEYVRTVFLDRYDDVSLSRVELRDHYRERGVMEFEVDVVLSDVALTFADGIDITPMLAGYIEQTPFEAESRKTPVQLEVPESLSLDVRLRHPRGMTPELPEAVPVISIQGARLEQAIRRDGNTMVYRFALERSGTRFRVSEYDTLRAIYARWLELSQERWRVRKGA